MAKVDSIAELWLTAAGHSLWEHLDGEPIPWRKAAWDKTILSDPRAEALLIGSLLVLPEATRRGAVGLESWHFRNAHAAAIWRGESQPCYEVHALREFQLALDAVVDEQIVLHWQGQQTPHHDASAEQVAAALAERVLHTYEARQLLQEAERLLRDTTAPVAAARGGVVL